MFGSTFRRYDQCAFGAFLQWLRINASFAALTHVEHSVGALVGTAVIEFELGVVSRRRSFLKQWITPITRKMKCKDLVVGAESSPDTNQ
jgi:hypothetical protein